MQFFYGRYLKKLSNRTQEALGEMSQRAQESLSALRTVQTFNARTWEEGQFKTKVHQVLDLGKKEALASGIFFGTLAFFSLQICFIIFAVMVTSRCVPGSY